MGFVNRDSVSNFGSCNNGSKSLNSCKLFPVKMTLDKLGRNSCKLSAIRLKVNERKGIYLFFVGRRDMEGLRYSHDTIVIQQQTLHSWQKWKAVQTSYIVIGKINCVELIECGTHIFDLWYFVSYGRIRYVRKCNEIQRIRE